MKTKKGFWVLAFAFLLMLARREPVFAETTVPLELSKVEATAEIAESGGWSGSCEGSVVTVRYVNPAQSNGSKAMLYVNGVQGNDGRFSDGTVVLQFDFAGAADGIYEAVIFEQVSVEGLITHYSGYNSLKISVSGGNAFFYFPAGASEEAFYQYVCENVDPKEFVGFPAYAYDCKNLNEIVTTALVLTEGLTTDEQKVRALHDWLATNIAYDYAAYNKNEYKQQADPAWVFENKRGVCSGYARLARIMFGAVGIPCLNISGVASNDNSLKANYKYSGTNHEWNMVYVDSQWKIMDITWDALNKYYGTSDDVTGQPPKYSYYEIAPYKFGVDHCSQKDYLTTFKWYFTEDVSRAASSGNARTYSLSKTSFVYNGKVQKPTVTVLDENAHVIDPGSYDVTYSKGCKNVGKYTVTIKMKQSGATKKLTYTILPAATKITKLTGQSKAFSVQVKKQATQTDGYQIQYATTKNFQKGTTKSVLIPTPDTCTKKIAKLESKKTYYVRVRTYKTVIIGGKETKLYSAWSTVSSVRTK